MSAVIEQQQQPQQQSLLAKFASRFGVEPHKMLATLKATAFKGDVTNEQMMALIIVADQYGLNPWTKEIYAFPDKGGVVPVVGLDGWARIINSHAEFDGMEFEAGPDDAAGLPAWIECVIYRKDRAHPVRAREYLAECRRNTGPWNSHPRRMLRHKAMIQCARLAFGFGGIYDQDEAERIVEMGPADAVAPPAPVADLNERVRATRKTPTVNRPLDGEDAAPALSYAQVRDQIERATSSDTLDLAADLIGQVADEGQRAELSDIYHERRQAVAG